MSFSIESSLRPPFSSSTHTPSLLRLITTKKGRLTFDKERRDIRTSTFKGDYKGRRKCEGSEKELKKNSDLVTEFLETTHTHFKIKEQIFYSVSSRLT